MHYNEYLNRYILLPMADIVGRTSILEKRRFLLKSQWWNEERIRALQMTKLKRLIRHAYHNVPFYRKSFKKCGIDPSDIKTLEDIQKIPILRRSDVRQNLSQMIARNLPVNSLVQGRTAGSTGEPLQFYRDRDSKSWAWGAMHRFFSWTGLRFGEPIITVSGGSLGGFLTSRALQGQILNTGKRWMGNHNIPAFPLSETVPAEILNITKRKGLRAIRAYPSVLFAIAESANRQMVDIEGIEICLTTAELLHPHWRKKIEKTFSAFIYDQYGCGEIHSIAAQCECKDSLHAFDEHVFVESPQVGIGDNGLRKAVITNLDNFGTPFIRYENGDVLSFSEKSCSCGRALTSIDEVVGRTHDFLVSSDGRPVAGKFILLLFMKVRGFERYFVHQKSKHEIIVQIVQNDKYSEAEVKELIVKMKEVLGNDVLIEFVKVNRIEEPFSMKFSCVKSDASFF